MTTKNTTMALAKLAEKGADADFLREMIQYVALSALRSYSESLCCPMRKWSI
jgi:hypothetical protein